MEYPSSNILRQKWKSQSVMEALRFYPDETVWTTLKGKLSVVIYLNKVRMKSRRQPGDFVALAPANNRISFNFNNVDKREILWSDESDCIMVNASPAVRDHSMFIPDRQLILPQLVTSSSLEKAMRVQLNLNSSQFVVGFNSPFAGATVNHLHYHILYLPSFNLPITQFNFEKLEESNCKLLFSDSFYRRQYKIVIELKSDSLAFWAGIITRWVAKLTELNLSYNMVIMTPESGSLELFFLPRKPIELRGDWMATGFLELTGFVLISTDEEYKKVCEEDVVRYLKEWAELSIDQCNEIEAIFLDSLKES